MWNRASSGNSRREARATSDRLSRRVAKIVRVRITTAGLEAFEGIRCRSPSAGCPIRFADAHRGPVDAKQGRGGEEHSGWLESGTPDVSGMQDKGLLSLTVFK